MTRTCGTDLVQERAKWRPVARGMLEIGFEQEQGTEDFSDWSKEEKKIAAKDAAERMLNLVFS
jgi:hypothetical protein